MRRAMFPGGQALNVLHDMTNVGIVGLSKVSTGGVIVGNDDSQRRVAYIGPMRTQAVVGEHHVGTDFWIRVG